MNPNTDHTALTEAGPVLPMMVLLVAFIGAFLAVAWHELDGRYARLRRNECADLKLVWMYQGDYCAREVVR